MNKKINFRNYKWDCIQEINTNEGEIWRAWFPLTEEWYEWREEARDEYTESILSGDKYRSDISFINARLDYEQVLLFCENSKPGFYQSDFIANEPVPLEYFKKSYPELENYLEEYFYKMSWMKYEPEDSVV